MILQAADSNVGAEGLGQVQGYRLLRSQRRVLRRRGWCYQGSCMFGGPRWGWDERPGGGFHVFLGT